MTGVPGPAHDALIDAGFTKVEAPEVQLFPGEINRVGLYRKDVVAGERLSFGELVLLIMGKDVETKFVTSPAVRP